MNNDLCKEGTGLCSPKDLLKAINEDALWDFLLKNNEISGKTLLIGDCTINYFE